MALCEQKVRDILVKSYEKHLDAKIAFESRLSAVNRRILDAAWREYTQEPTDGLLKELFQTYHSDDIPETETQCRKDAIARLEKLLLIAQYE